MKRRTNPTPPPPISRALSMTATPRFARASAPAAQDGMLLLPILVSMVMVLLALVVDLAVLFG